VAYEDRGVITVSNPKADADDPPKNFTFDAVFGAEVTQRHIYEVCAADLIESCLAGYNGTIFAYGQTVGLLLSSFYFSVFCLCPLFLSSFNSGCMLS
jgi:hypothetical protein